MAFGDVDPFSMDAILRYEEALVEAQKDGVPIKALFLCSPHNPLGDRSSELFFINNLTVSKVAAIPERFSSDL